MNVQTPLGNLVTPKNGPGTYPTHTTVSSIALWKDTGFFHDEPHTSYKFVDITNEQNRKISIASFPWICLITMLVHKTNTDKWPSKFEISQ